MAKPLLLLKDIRGAFSLRDLSLLVCIGILFSLCGLFFYERVNLAKADLAKAAPSSGKVYAESNLPQSVLVPPENPYRPRSVSTSAKLSFPENARCDLEVDSVLSLDRGDPLLHAFEFAGTKSFEPYIDLGQAIHVSEPSDGPRPRDFKPAGSPVGISLRSIEYGADSQTAQLRFGGFTSLLCQPGLSFSYKCSAVGCPSLRALHFSIVPPGDNFLQGPLTFALIGGRVPNARSASTLDYAGLKPSDSVSFRAAPLGTYIPGVSGKEPIYQEIGDYLPPLSWLVGPISYLFGAMVYYLLVVRVWPKKLSKPAAWLLLFGWLTYLASRADLLYRGGSYGGSDWGSTGNAAKSLDRQLVQYGLPVVTIFCLVLVLCAAPALIVALSSKLPVVAMVGWTLIIGLCVRAAVLEVVNRGPKHGFPSLWIIIGGLAVGVVGAAILGLNRRGAVMIVATVLGAVVAIGAEANDVFEDVNLTAPLVLSGALLLWQALTTFGVSRVALTAVALSVGAVLATAKYPPDFYGAPSLPELWFSFVMLTGCSALVGCWCFKASKELDRFSYGHARVIITSIVICFSLIWSNPGGDDIYFVLIAVPLLYWLPARKSGEITNFGTSITPRQHQAIMNAELRRRIMNRVSLDYARESKRKLTDGTLDLVEYRRNQGRFDKAGDARQRMPGCPATTASLAFSSNGGIDGRIRAREGFLVAAFVSLPAVVIDILLSATGLNVEQQAIWSLRWPIYGAIYGYFYTFLRGQTPIAKAAYLGSAIGILEIVRDLVQSPFSSELSVLVSLRIGEVVLLSLALGLAWERKLAAVAGVAWARVRNFRALNGMAAPLLAILVALATAIGTGLGAATVARLAPTQTAQLPSASQK